MPQYMMSVHHDGTEELEAMTPEQMQPIFEAVDRFNEKVREAGAWVFGGGLEGIDASTTVDATGEKVIVTDGPFAESKEYLGGFWVIEAPDLDSALKWAEEGSAACQGKVEVRPFQAG